MIKELIYDYWDSTLPQAYQRDAAFDIETPLIIDIIGPRRAGKTYLMFNIIKELISKYDKRSTIYLNFENRKLYPLSADYINQIVAFIYAEQLLERFDRLFLFLDEVQCISGWEKFVRGIYDEFKGRIKIFVSGSNTELLSRAYGELLTGRHLTCAVFPLRFKEFLVFKGIPLEHSSEKGRIGLETALEEYLRFGGFPEITLTQQPAKKEEMLTQLFSDILSRDILTRAVRKEQVLEEFAYYLASNTATLLSFRKMVNHFKSRGIGISVATLENYFYHIKSAFLFFDTMIFSYSTKNRLQYPRKVYCVDNGLLNLTGLKFSENLGKSYENAAAAHLFLQAFRDSRMEISYWKDSRQAEVDFVIKEGIEITRLIQVCAVKERGKIPEREIKSLLSGSAQLKCGELFLITAGYEGEEEIKGKKVRFIPLWKWLLAEENLP